MQRCFSLYFAIGLSISFALTGCSIDISDGTQLTGQRCFQESDCAVGLTCHDRVCTPRIGSVGGVNSNNPDAGNNSTNNASNSTTGNNATLNNLNNGNNANNGGPDAGPVDVGPGECVIGDRRCISDLTYEVCIDVGGRAEFRRVQCGDGEICEGGRCVSIEPPCEDRDGDGYGPGCRLGGDCNDDDSSVNPGVPEDCTTPYDDNCNGGVNEGCNPGDCCPQGCDADVEFCSTSCVCQPYDPLVCEFQNQPCVDEGSFENGFVCAAFGSASGARCWGVCSVDADDPDATCPDPNTVCAFDSGDGQNGLCMSTCEVNPGTGESSGCPSDPELGCLTVDVSVGDGICTPINPAHDRGDFCESENFFDCDEGLVCVSFQGGPTGRCRQGCRPFFWGGANTDCRIGHCLGFSDSFGMCVQDTMADEGDECVQQFRTCQEDAVACYPNGQGGTECLRLCRLDEGDSDCVQPGDACVQFDGNQDELGVCF